MRSMCSENTEEGNDIHSRGVQKNNPGERKLNLERQQASLSRVM